MIKTSPIETILRGFYKNQSPILVIYYWDWRLNRFFREIQEEFGFKVNSRDFENHSLIEISLTNIDKDKINNLIKLTKKLNFKFVIID